MAIKDLAIIILVLIIIERQSKIMYLKNSIAELIEFASYLSKTKNQEIVKRLKEINLTLKKANK